MLAVFFISGLIGLVFLVLNFFVFIFWIWMLIDCIRNNRLSSDKRVIWALVVFFLYGLGALIYYLAGRDGT